MDFDHETRDAYEEAQRIIRISDEVRITLERVAAQESGDNESDNEPDASTNASSKLTTSKVAQKRIALVQMLQRVTAGCKLTQRERRTGTVAQQTFEPRPVGTLDAHRAIHREAAVDDAAVEMHVLVQAGAETVDESDRPLRRHR